MVAKESERIKWGLAMQARMERLGISQAALGRTMEYDAKAVRNWLAGKNSCKRINKLADVLFPGAGDSDPEKQAFVRQHDNAFNDERHGQPGPGGTGDPPPPPEPPNNDGSFRLGDIEARMIVLDQKRSGYSYAEFRSVLVDWADPPMPEAWKERWSAAAAEASELLRAGDINDNPIVALRNVWPRRDGVGEPNGFHLTFSTINYVEKRTATIFFNKFLSPAERHALLEDVRDWRLHPILARCLNTNVAVVTSDGKIMFARRSGRIINPGKAVCGIAETMDESDITAPDGRTAPDIFRAALRGLDQEFGIDLQQVPDNPHDVVKLLSLTFDMDYYEPVFVGVADFRKASAKLRAMATARNIEDGLRSGRAKDRWENKDVSFVDLALQPIFDYVHRNDLTSYGIVCLIHALQFAGFSDERIIDEHRRSREGC